MMITGLQKMTLLDFPGRAAPRHAHERHEQQEVEPALDQLHRQPVLEEVAEQGPVHDDPVAAAAEVAADAGEPVEEGHDQRILRDSDHKLTINKPFGWSWFNSVVQIVKHLFRCKRQ